MAGHDSVKERVQTSHQNGLDEALMTRCQRTAFENSPEKIENSVENLMDGDQRAIARIG